MAKIIQTVCDVHTRNEGRQVEASTFMVAVRSGGDEIVNAGIDLCAECARLLVEPVLAAIEDCGWPAEEDKPKRKRRTPRPSTSATCPHCGHEGNSVQNVNRHIGQKHPGMELIEYKKGD